MGMGYIVYIVHVQNYIPKHFLLVQNCMMSALENKTRKLLLLTYKI
jgi:hypothetical protein